MRLHRHRRRIFLPETRGLFYEDVPDVIAAGIEPEAFAKTRNEGHDALFALGGPRYGIEAGEVIEDEHGGDLVEAAVTHIIHKR